jgi:fructosamine-3-kinase
MLHLCKRDGAAFPREQQLRTKVAWVLYSERAYTLLQVRQILSTHKCVPSLVHGDLWSGNTGYVADGAPVIFDPATYYGDR